MDLTVAEGGLEMENQLVWKDEFNIGVEEIDREHQRLCSVINKLFSLGKEGEKGRRACEEGIKYFYEHTLKHFADEEKYMFMDQSFLYRMCAAVCAAGTGRGCRGRAKRTLRPVGCSN